MRYRRSKRTSIVLFGYGVGNSEIFKFQGKFKIVFAFDFTIGNDFVDIDITFTFHSKVQHEIIDAIEVHPIEILIHMDGDGIDQAQWRIITDRKHHQFGVSLIARFPLHFYAFTGRTSDKLSGTFDDSPLNIHGKIQVQTDVIFIGQTGTCDVIPDDDVI